MSAATARQVAVIDFDGDRRQYAADEFDVRDGALVLTLDGKMVACFAPGWRSVSYTEDGQ